MKMRKRLCSMLLVIVMVAGLIPASMFAEASSDVPAGNTYYIADQSGNLSITENGTYRIALTDPAALGEGETAPTTTTNTISVAENTVVTIYLENVNIDVSTSAACAFSIGNGAKVTLILSGANVLKSGDGYAGLQVGSGATLTIQENGSGSLTAKGGLDAAGIGNGKNNGGGIIFIEGGSINAEGTSASSGTSAISIGGAGAVVIVKNGSFVGNTQTNISSGIATTGTDWVVKGNVTLPTSLTIPKGTQLTVSSGGKLTVPLDTTLTVEGTLNIETGGAVSNQGSVILRDGTVNSSGTYDGTAYKRMVTKFSYAASAPTVALNQNISNLVKPQSTASCIDYTSKPITGTWALLSGDVTLANTNVVLTLTFTLDTSDATLLFDSELVKSLNSGLSSEMKQMLTISLGSSGSTNLTTSNVLVYTYTVKVNTSLLPSNAFTLTQSSFVYTGELIEPAVTVNPDAGLTEDDYDIIYDATSYGYDNTNAGSGAVIIKGTGNYSGYITIPITITKATVHIEQVVTVQFPKDTGGNDVIGFTCVFDGKAHTIESFGVKITANTNYIGLGTPTVYYNDSTTVPTNAGTYTVTLKLPEGKNYQADNSNTIKLGTITITKAAAPTAATTAINVGPNQTNSTVSIASLLPSNANPQTATLTVTDKSNVIKGNPTFSNGALTYSTNAVSYGMTASIVLTVTMQNYENTTVTVNMTVVFKTTVTFTGLAATSKTYDGYQIYVTAPTGTISGGGTYNGAIEYWYSGTSGGTTYGPTTTAPKNVGTYTVTAKITSSNNQYEGSSSAVSFSITQKALTISPANVTVYLGNSLPNYYWLNYDGIVGNDAVNFTVWPTLELRDSAGKAVSPSTTVSGVYSIVWTNISTSIPSSSNYKITTGSTGTLTITLRPSTTSAGDLVYTAGQLAQVDTVSLSVDKDTMTKLTTTKNRLQMVTSFAELSFNASALAAVTKTSGATATITASETTVSSLPQSARATLAGALVYAFDVRSASGTKISSFGDDAVTVNITYYQRNSDKAIAVYHIDDNGGLTRMSKVTYDSSSYQVRFMASEFSSYAVVEVANPYSDIDHHWARAAIGQAYAGGLFTANTGDKFYPEDACTRAMLVTAMYRLAGEPSAKAYKLTFTDVSSTAWYVDAVKWASANGIMSGTGDGTFAPEASVTREEIATIFYRYAYYLGVGTEGTWNIRFSFADDDEISTWAYEGATFCQKNNIISGKPGNLFAPDALATRAEVAVMLQRFVDLTVNTLYQ